MKGALLLLGIVGGTVILGYFLPLDRWVERFAAWIRGLGSSAGVFYGFGYAVACLVVPGSLLTLVAGSLFGLAQGSIIVSLGSTAGACLAFLMARYLARRTLEARFAADPRFARIDHAVSRAGGRIVFLTRLSPVFPFIFLNYAFGLTRISLPAYLIASWTGMIPGTLMYIYAGSIVPPDNLAQLLRGEIPDVGQGTLFWIGLVVTVVVTIYITHLARSALRREIPPETKAS